MAGHGGGIMKPGLILRDIHIRHDNGLDVGLDVEIAPGDIVTLMGPSGSGKSSLLNYICGLLPSGFHGQGEVWLDGMRLDLLPAQQRGIGILFQDDLLFPFMSVAGNLGFGLSAKYKGKARAVAVEKALEDAGLAGFGGRDPATLSGGERARISLMRALLAEPKALLLDEPFSKLDQNLRENFRQFVFAAAKARHLPVLMVSHDIADAKAAGGLILQLGD